MDMTIGLLFGSFNPIHHGHLMILRYWLNETSLTSIWLIVSPQNPHKSPCELATPEDRLNMVQLAIAGEPHLLASDVEFHLPRPSYTIETLRFLRVRYPRSEWRILMGSDAFSAVPTWREGDTLLKAYEFWVYPRGEGRPAFLPEKAVFFSQAPRIDISATQIRTYLKKGQSIRFLVPLAVESYIYQHGLYGARATG